MFGAQSCCLDNRFTVCCHGVTSHSAKTTTGQSYVETCVQTKSISFSYKLFERGRFLREVLQSPADELYRGFNFKVFNEIFVFLVVLFAKCSSQRGFCKSFRQPHRIVIISLCIASHYIPPEINTDYVYLKIGNKAMVTWRATTEFVVAKS